MPRDYLTWSEQETVREVMEQYDLPCPEYAYQHINERAKGHSGRFYAYTVAHQVCSKFGVAL